MSIENLEQLPDMNGDATVNLSVDSLINFSEDWNMISAGNKNGYAHMSCQETPTLQRHQVSDAVDTDFCEEQAAKKRRLIPLDTSCCAPDKKESLEDKSRVRNWLSIEKIKQFLAVNDYPPAVNFATTTCAGKKNERRHLSTKKRRLCNTRA